MERIQRLNASLCLSDLCRDSPVLGVNGVRSGQFHLCGASANPAVYRASVVSVCLPNGVSIDEPTLALDLAKARHGIRKLCGILACGRSVD